MAALTVILCLPIWLFAPFPADLIVIVVFNLLAWPVTMSGAFEDPRDLRRGRGDLGDGGDGA